MNKVNQANNILILGMGREGISVLHYLNALPEFIGKITLYDAKSSQELDLDTDLIRNNATIFEKKITELSFDQFDCIIKSPGIPNRLLPSKISHKLTSATSIFFESCPCPIIGVTGTKGKSTTSSLIHAILTQAGYDSHLMGNIGEPALDHLSQLSKNSYVVYELSSHQLSHLTTSPHIAVVLAVFPEHLDYYHDFAEYLAAKSHIAQHQKTKDYIIYDSENQEATNIANLSQGIQLAISQNDKQQISKYQTQLKGQVYLTNLALSAKTAQTLNISDNIIKKAIKQFNPLPHRLEFIGIYRNIEFYNDSLATNPGATIAAIEALGDQVETIILGGSIRNLNYTVLAKKLIDSKIKNLITFSPVGDTIWQSVIEQNSQESKVFQHDSVSTMQEAIASAYQLTNSGKICLLSPAAPSFSNFRDYADRGDQFKKYVQELSVA